MTRVALATDRHSVYEFFAPLTVRVWQEVVGWPAVIALVGAKDEWTTNKRSALVYNELCTSFADIFFVDTPPGYRSANVAQIARMYAALDSRVYSDEVVVTSDIDMWPTDSAWFEANLPNPGEITSYYANFPSRFPMCYVAADRTTWRKILKVWSTDVAQHVQDHMLAYLSPATAAPDAWQHDEEFLTKRIYDSGAKINEVKRPSGEPFPDRIDRVAWPSRLSLEGKRDAHLLRPGLDHWPKLRELITLLCPKILNWADQYVDTYHSLFIGYRNLGEE